MRIITGIYKGRRLQPKEDGSVRPTTDFARTGLFNVLENELAQDWESVYFLDLFAGFGSLSLETLSRGAKKGILNDINPKNIQWIKSIFEKWGVEKNQTSIQFFVKDALQCVHFLPEGTLFDLIFVDPPYAYPDYDPLIEKLLAKNLLCPQTGLMIVEHDKDKNFENHPYFYKMKKYGKVHFSFLQIP